MLAGGFDCSGPTPAYARAAAASGAQSFTAYCVQNPGTAWAACANLPAGALTTTLPTHPTSSSAFDANPCPPDTLLVGGDCICNAGRLQGSAPRRAPTASA